MLHLLCLGDFSDAPAPHDLPRVLHLAQLALQYLVFVQDQLATENAALRTEDHGQRALQLRVAELKQRLALTQHELKRYRKTTKTYEVRVAAECGDPPSNSTHPPLQYLASAGSALDASPVVVSPASRPSPDKSEVDALRQQLADLQRALEDARQQGTEAQQRGGLNSTIPDATARQFAQRPSKSGQQQHNNRLLKRLLGACRPMCSALSARRGACCMITNVTARRRKRRRTITSTKRQQQLLQVSQHDEFRMIHHTPKGAICSGCTALGTAAAVAGGRRSPTDARARKGHLHTHTHTTYPTRSHRTHWSSRSWPCGEPRNGTATHWALWGALSGSCRRLMGRSRPCRMRWHSTDGGCQWRAMGTLHLVHRWSSSRSSSGNENVKKCVVWLHGAVSRSVQAQASTSQADWRDVEIERLHKEVQRLAEEGSSLKQQRQVVLQRCAAAEQEAAVLRQAAERVQSVVQGQQSVVQGQQSVVPVQHVPAAVAASDDGKGKKTLLGKLSQGWGWRGKGGRQATAEHGMLAPQAVLVPAQQQMMPMLQPVLPSLPMGTPALQQAPQSSLPAAPSMQLPAVPPALASSAPTSPPVTVVDLWDSAPKPAAADPAPTAEAEFTIAADWGGVTPAPVVAPPLEVGLDGPLVGPIAKQPLVPVEEAVIAAAASKDDDLFGGFADGGPVHGEEGSAGDRTLKPVRSIIKTSSFAERGLQKSPSGRRVAFNLPEVWAVGQYAYGGHAGTTQGP